MELRNHVTTFDVMKRGPLPVLQMAARAQEIYRDPDSPKLISVGGAKDIMKELRSDDAPDAFGAAYRAMVKL